MDQLQGYQYNHGCGLTPSSELLQQNVTQLCVPVGSYFVYLCCFTRGILHSANNSNGFIAPKIGPSPKPCDMIRNVTSFYARELLAHRPIPKLEDHILSTVRDCLGSILNRKRDYRWKNRGSISFGSVEHFKYSRTTRKNHCFRGEIRANGT